MIPDLLKLFIIEIQRANEDVLPKILLKNVHLLKREVKDALSCNIKMFNAHLCRTDVDETSAAFLVYECLDTPDWKQVADYDNSRCGFDSEMVDFWRPTSDSASDVEASVAFQSYLSDSASDVEALVTSPTKFQVSRIIMYALERLEKLKNGWSGTAKDLLSQVVTMPRVLSSNNATGIDKGQGVWIPSKWANPVIMDVSALTSAPHYNCDMSIDAAVKISSYQFHSSEMLPVQRFTRIQLAECKDNFTDVDLARYPPVPIINFTMPVAVCTRAVPITFTVDTASANEYLYVYNFFDRMTEYEMLKVFAPDIRAWSFSIVRLIGSGMRRPQTSDLDNVLNLDGEKYHGGLVFELITTDPATESRDDYFEILSCFHHHLSERKCLPSIRKTAALNCTVQLCTIPTSSEWVIDRFNFLQISEREICF